MHMTIKSMEKVSYMHLIWIVNYDYRGEVIIKSIYSRLLKLYRKNKDSGKIPLEDYTTEILVDLLQKNKDIRSHFVTEILEIQEENFKI